MDLSIYALSKDEGPAVWFLNSLLVVKASAKQTGNAYGLMEVLAPVGVTGRFKTSHLWALQNQPLNKEVIPPSLPIVSSVRGPYSRYHPLTPTQ
jgi:hypothetical protein